MQSVLVQFRLPSPATSLGLLKHLWQPTFLIDGNRCTGNVYMPEIVMLSAAAPILTDYQDGWNQNNTRFCFPVTGRGNRHLQAQPDGDIPAEQQRATDGIHRRIGSADAMVIRDKHCNVHLLYSQAATVRCLIAGIRLSISPYADRHGSRPATDTSSFRIIRRWLPPSFLDRAGTTKSVSMC